MLGLSFSPSVIIKISGKVIALNRPLKKSCILRKGYGQNLILDIDVVIDCENYMQCKTSKPQHITEVPWAVQLSDGTVVNVDSREAELDLESITDRDGKTCMFLRANSYVTAIGSVTEISPDVFLLKKPFFKMFLISHCSESQLLNRYNTKWKLWLFGSFVSGIGCLLTALKILFQKRIFLKS